MRKLTMCHHCKLPIPAGDTYQIINEKPYCQICFRYLVDFIAYTTVLLGKMLIETFPEIKAIYDSQK